MNRDGGDRRTPPKEHQFKPGQSGNPRGRPRKPRRAHIPSQIRKDVLKVAGSKIKKPGTDDEITIMEGFFHALSLHAIKGKPFAMKLFGEFLAGALHENIRANPELELIDKLEQTIREQGFEMYPSTRTMLDELAEKSLKPS